MNIRWVSHKGKSRKLNNDAVALAYVGKYLIAVVVDAAERSAKGRLCYGANDQGKRLAAYWADTCVQTIQLEPKALECEQTLIKLLELQQNKLRSHYLFDIASYGLLIFNTTTGDARYWYTGDCRLGYENSSGSIRWLNIPHRLDEFLLFQVGTDKVNILDPTIQHVAEHKLTKSLNVRRFIRPDRIDVRFSIDGSTDMKSVLIATDGYWCEHLISGVHEDVLHDDASFLTISSGTRNIQLDTDAPNVYIAYRL